MSHGYEMRTCQRRKTATLTTRRSWPSAPGGSAFQKRNERRMAAAEVSFAMACPDEVWDQAVSRMPSWTLSCARGRPECVLWR